MKKFMHILNLFVAISLLAGCGGSSDSSTDVEPVFTVKSGFLRIGLTDAPVDDAAKVVVEFDGVVIKPAGTDEIEYTFEPRQIDLLSLQGGGSELLLDDVEVIAGEYQWIRLMVNAERNTLDSYVELEDTNQISLFVPSGAQTGLKLNDSFTVLAGGNTDLIIDFDLRKSITNPRGQPDYFLKPRLRLIDNSVSGDITGMVAESLITAEGCSEAASVYVFESSTSFEGGITLDEADDIDIVEEGDDIGGADPLTTATVTMNEDNTYSYMAAFLAPGDYILALTCQADLDQNDIDNTLTDTNIPEQVVSFVTTVEVTVTENETTIYDFEDSTN